MPDFDDLVTGLSVWAANAAVHEQAAVELILWHEGWLRRSSFIRECMKHYTQDDGSWGIIWDRAREYADKVKAGGLDAPRASSSEAAVLDFAVALGENRYHLSGLGHAHRKAFALAMAAAAGLAAEGIVVPGG